MALVNKQDSNSTGLRYAVEVSPGVVDGSAVWLPLEPNSYKNFGGDVKTKARMPISDTRQLKKGVVVDLDAGGGFIQDLTADNFQDPAQCFMYAALRKKDELATATVDGTGNQYEPGSGGAGYVAGDLLFAKKFSDDHNNGLKVVSGTPDATHIPVTDTGLVDGATQTGIISRVGYQFPAGLLTVDISGSFPALVSTGRATNSFGLIPGEFIYIGDDASTKSFFRTVNNGFARIRSITSTHIFLDKTQNTMLADDGTVNGAGGAGNTIRIYFGRVLKNESDPTLIIKRGVQVERTLGAPDDSQPTQIQAEYLVRSLADNLKLDAKTADIIRLELDFTSNTNELRTGAQGVKAGSRPTIADTDAFNSTSDVSFTKMAVVTVGNASPAPLFGFFTDFTMEIKNNLKQNKAVSVLGAFDSTPGFFQVTSSVTAYFTDVAAIQAVRDNKTITLETHFVKFNKGVTLDLPCLVMSKALADVKLNEAIMIPLGADAAAGTAVDAALNHTLLWVFWDYLPTVAG